MASNGGTFNETLINVNVDNSNYGVIAGLGVRLQINRSVITKNATAGVYNANAIINVDSSVISYNATGIVGDSFTFVSNNDVSFNTAAALGFVRTFGNNCFINSTTLGGTLSPLGSSASDPVGLL